MIARAQAVLAQAKRGAINFHDGPLPRHAGLNAPVWAILEQEKQHGVTWHLIEGGIDEGDIALQGIRIPSTSLNQSLTLQRQIEKAATSLPEVAYMFSKTGTAEVGTDPMPANISDSFVILKPKDEWPAGVDTKDEVIERLEAKLKPLVGSAFEISIRELTETIARLTGFEGRIVWDTTKPNGQPRRKLDTSRAAERFGFVSRIPFEEGLRRTIAWYEAHRAVPVG